MRAEKLGILRVLIRLWPKWQTLSSSTDERSVLDYSILCGNLLAMNLLLDPALVKDKNAKFMEILQLAGKTKSLRMVQSMIQG